MPLKQKTVWYLLPDEQTYGWLFGKYLEETMWIDLGLVWVQSQTSLLIDILTGESEHSWGIFPYSNNNSQGYVSEIGNVIQRFARTINWERQRMVPEQLIAMGRVPIEQCLIWKKEIDIRSAKKLYVHSASLIQVASWVKKNIGPIITSDCEASKEGIVAIECDSNGDAINRAIYDDDPCALGVWPEFAVKQWVVLRKWIDNNSNSETSFAVISNPDNPLILPEYEHKGDFWAISYAKVSQLWDSQIPVALQLYNIKRYGNRTMPSPKSWMAVIWKDVEAHSRADLEAFLDALNRWLPWMKIEGYMEDRHVTLEWDWVEEHQYVGPCRLFNIPRDYLPTQAV